MGLRLVDIAKMTMIYLLYLAVKLVNWDRSEVLVSTGLSLSASDGSRLGTLLTHVLARFSCSLPLSTFLFSPTHNVLHKKLILHLRAFMHSYKQSILPDALAHVSHRNRGIAPLSLARSSKLPFKACARLFHYSFTLGFCTICFFPTYMLHLDVPILPLKCSVSLKSHLNARIMLIIQSFFKN